jgi:single-strand DNA-binding protein
MGRLVKDPDIRYSQGQKSMAIARYTLAVDRAVKKDREQTADFISCVAFDKNGEFAEKYLHKGTKIAIEGRIQTGSYTDKEGRKVYTTDIVVEHHEFCESRNASSVSGNNAPDADGFVNIPDNVEDEALPFN